MRTFFIAVSLSVCFKPVYAAELRLLPAEIAFTGPNASQQLMLVRENGAKAVEDLTDRAVFQSSNSKVVIIEDGRARAVGNGEAVITATTPDGKQASARIHVSKANMPDPPGFRNRIIPILTRAGCNSGSCHGALAGKGGLKLSLRGYDPESDHLALTRQALSRRVDMSRPEHSLMLLKASRTLPHGGGRRLPVDERDYNLVLEWIKAGALPPRSTDSRLQRIEILPRQALLEPRARMPVLVRACYSDGRVEDVTRWSRFGSSDEDVIKIDDEGEITVAGNGEAAVTISFGTAVATMLVTSPFPNRPDDAVFTAARGDNAIDKLIIQKLCLLRLPPSPPSSDQEFIRRAFLDAAGILPTPAEVEHFVADKSARKREALVDTLLERGEFVDYWSYKWSDLLLVSSRRLQQPEMWAFYRAIRQSVADDKPWDQFARDILLADGSTLQSGGGNFFVLHKDTAELTEAVSVTFLGMSITCARCHNHPLEKWTQDQYWALANLFARIGLKKGDRPGESIVVEKQSGDVLHPRRGYAMPPAPLDGAPLAGGDPRGRRAYFTDWLTAPDNPFFARALVNRVWRNFMGRGLVEAEDDLRETNPPSNPELLDLLAREFVHNKYDVKWLIRRIMNSAAYQRSSKTLKENEMDTRFYSHYLVRRLPGEVILDCMSQVTSSPTAFNLLYINAERNTQATTSYPLGTRALQLPDSQVASRFLDAFGRPERSAPCSCERQQDATVGQALMVNNGQVLNDKLRAKNSRIDDWLSKKIGDDVAVDRAFALALGRKPTAQERSKCVAILSKAPVEKAVERREALEDLFWAVVSTREFLFNH